MSYKFPRATYRDHVESRWLTYLIGYAAAGRIVIEISNRVTDHESEPDLSRGPEVADRYVYECYIDYDNSWM